MEINLNTSGISYGNINGVSQADAAAGFESKNALASSRLTISEGIASAEDVQAAGIPEEALTRDDALGRLMSQAFSLPPPPMPNFL